MHSFRNIRYYNVLNNRIRELCGATKLDTIRNEIIRDNESGGNVQESPRKKVEVVWACDWKRGAVGPLRRNEGNVLLTTRVVEEERKAYDNLVGQCEG